MNKIKNIRSYPLYALIVAVVVALSALGFIPDTTKTIDSIPYDFSQYTYITDEIYLDNLDSYIVNSYKKYDDNGWNGLVDGQSEGTKAGGNFGNYEEQLPVSDNYNNKITYKEFDVNDKIEGQSRDAERFVVGSDDSVYYTNNHYDTYVYIIE